MDTADTKPLILRESENPPCRYERNSLLWGGEEDEGIRGTFEGARPTAADVIGQGNVVRFCEMCFPELASRGEDAMDE